MVIFGNLSRNLNIVSFDVPWPPNYGGVIDVYYKLYWLNQQGIKIHLHCFEYGRGGAAELEKLCERVYYYPRKTGFLSALTALPYTVASRRSRQLEKNLLENNYPVLFEVLHTCYLLKDKRFAGRKKIYRHSNIEHDYYRELARSEKNSFKKMYLRLEAWRLKKFENIISGASLILAVNQKDTDYFQQKFPSVKTVYLPSFHASHAVSGKEGRGDYVLFHGNLSISENYEAALQLVENVFSKTDKLVVIAGLNPPPFLVKEIVRHKNIKLVENPDDEKMNDLVANAQVNVLYTNQPTGLKLKLLNVLFKGRFVLLNQHLLSGTGLSANDSMRVEENLHDFVAQIEKLSELPMNQEMLNQRKIQLMGFNNELNALKLVETVFA